MDPLVFIDRPQTMAFLNVRRQNTIHPFHCTVHSLTYFVLCRMVDDANDMNKCRAFVCFMRFNKNYCFALSMYTYHILLVCIFTWGDHFDAIVRMRLSTPQTP